MTTLHHSVRIDAPPDLVFRVASNIPDAAEHISGITRVEMVTDGPVGKGTRWRETRLMFKKEHTEELEITGWDPPRSYTVGCESCGTRWSSSLRFLPENSGTRVELEMIGTPLTFMAKIMGFLMKPMMSKAMRKCIEDDMADIKKVCETSSPGAGVQTAPA